MTTQGSPDDLIKCLEKAEEKENNAVVRSDIEKKWAMFTKERVRMSKGERVSIKLLGAIPGTFYVTPGKVIKSTRLAPPQRLCMDAALFLRTFSTLDTIVLSWKHSRERFLGSFMRLIQAVAHDDEKLCVALPDRGGPRCQYHYIMYQ